MKPYYEYGGITLFHADFRDESIEREHAAVTIADPPYAQTSLVWDKWPKGWLQAVRSDALWMFGTVRMFMEQAAEITASEWRLSQDVVWEKHNGSSFHNDRFRRTHESVALFYQGEWEDIYRMPQFTMDATKRTVRRKQRPPHMGNIGTGFHTSVDGGPRMERSVFHVRSCHGDAQNETQKPLGILRPLLRYSAPPGSLVHDAFAGSGSTLVVAKELGLRAVGWEVREEQCEIAANRLSQEVMNFEEGS